PPASPTASSTGSAPRSGSPPTSCTRGARSGSKASPRSSTSCWATATSAASQRRVRIMAKTVEVQVPDIGDFHDVPIIEVLVRPGDTVAKDDSLIALESEKATMEVPAPFAGKVTQVQVKVGDRVSKGSPILTLEVDESAEAAPEAAPAPETQASAPRAEAPAAAGPADAART